MKTNSSGKTASMADDIQVMGPVSMTPAVAAHVQARYEALRVEVTEDDSSRLLVQDFQVVLGLRTVPRSDSSRAVVANQVARALGLAPGLKAYEGHTARKGKLIEVRGVVVLVTKREKIGSGQVKIHFEDCGNGLPASTWKTDLTVSSEMYYLPNSSSTVQGI
jgi:hypothetical protein